MKALRIVHDGTVTVSKTGGIILGKRSLEDILYTELNLDATSYSETFNANVTIMVEPKKADAVVRWLTDADE